MLRLPKWTPVGLLLLLGVIGTLEHLGILGSPAPTVLEVLSIGIGLAWALGGEGRLCRLSELYLWLVFVFSMGTVEHIADGLATSLGMTDTLTVHVGVSIAHLLAIGVALWILGGWRGEKTRGRPKPWPAGLAAGLLVMAAAIVWLGATTWPGTGLEKIAAHQAEHLLTHGSFLLGGIIALAGLMVLTVTLREAGDRLLSELGLAAFLLGTVFWIIYLAFRLTVVPAAAQEMAETGALPPWFEILDMGSGLFYAIYVVMAYLAIAAYGGALVKTGLLPRWLGWTCTVVGLAAASLFAAGVPGFGLPLEIPILPYLMGMLLLQRGR